MYISDKFIRLNEKYSAFYEHVPAPMFRKEIFVDKKQAEKYEITITAAGFYDLFINGERITKGYLAPYISAPCDLLYYDVYDITDLLRDGNNCIGVVLGNGIQNDMGRWEWCFDQAKWRGYVRFAMALEITDKEGNTQVLEGEGGWKVSESPIIFDSLYLGEHYDANKEQKGWNQVGFDDSAWQDAERAEKPLGEPSLCEAEPITKQYDLFPVSVVKEDGGYVYDFGYNCAGLVTLRIKNATKGQKIIMTFGEAILDGKFNDKNVLCLPPIMKYPEKDVHYKDVYICKGEAEEVYTPSFTYHGFQYVHVEGLRDDQAEESLLVYHVLNSNVKQISKFSCSNEVVNSIQDMVIRSNLANLYYFPTDCPHREKNGWTGDAALSAEQMTLNLGIDTSFREWMKNIRKAQEESGALSGFVPTPGWRLHYDDYPGPAWDWVMAEIPYQLYIYRGDRKVLEENATMLGKYLNYIVTRKNERGLIDYGFGDWVQAGVIDVMNNPVDCPTEVSSTACAIDIAEKCAFIFRVLGMEERAIFADAVAQSFRHSFAKHLIDWENLTVAGECQTSQTLGLYLNFFNEEQKSKALAHLIEYINKYEDHLHVGVIGGRLIFHVLTQNGYAELAYKMIVRSDFPSYGFFKEINSTTMWEGFVNPNIELAYSRNHHFWGDVSHWFYRYLAGFNVNPSKADCSEINIKPYIIADITFVEATHETPYGKIAVEWKKEGESLSLKVEKALSLKGKLFAPDGWVFEDGEVEKALGSGNYVLRKK